jgi:hypothetical protein
MFAHAVLDTGQFQYLGCGFGEGKTLGLVYVYQIPAAVAGTKTFIPVMFFIVNEAGSVFFVERAAGFQIPLIEVLQFQFLCDDMCLGFAQTLLGFFYQFLFNEQDFSLLYFLVSVA